MNTPRTFPAHAIKGGDQVHGHEVFDVIDTLGPGGRVAILFTDGTRHTVATWSTEVEVQN